VEKREPSLWQECNLVHPLQKTVCSFLKKLKLELPYEPAIQILGMYQEKMKKKKTNSKRHIHHKFIAALVTIAETWKQPKCPSTDEWIKKMWYMHTLE